MMLLSTRHTLVCSATSAAAPKRSIVPCSRKSLRVCAKLGDQPGSQKETSGADQGSFGKIEAPVRDTAPDGLKVNVEDRDTDQFLRSKEANKDTEWFGTEVGFLDGMRFYGAIPEVNNCRLAMLGFFSAIVAEATTGLNLFQQVQAAPVPIAAVFLTITAATTIPVVRGLPRRGNSVFSPDAELINGRLAMLAFLSIVTVTALHGSYLDTWPFWVKKTVGI
ncbi:hypothetical protein WJX73_005960 [Symbiochloris irregularis]|uniref:Uncharacterized protein n=1 Tax=Symbiochloris irregularis TaxID=706552 RepID=A0AAW1PVV2_9CHLO